MFPEAKWMRHSAAIEWRNYSASGIMNIPTEMSKIHATRTVTRVHCHTRVQLRVMQTRTREGYGVCGYGYGVGSEHPRVTRTTPYNPYPGHRGLGQTRALP